MRRRSRIEKETTILYGVLIRIGGYTRPRAYMQFLDGRKLSCSIASRSVAIQMSPYLYQSVGVRGIALWDTQDRTLLHFHIEEMLPKQESPADTFKGLVDMVEKYYDHDALDDEE